MSLIRLVVVDNQNFRQIVMLFKEKYFKKITLTETNVQQKFSQSRTNEKIPYQILTG